MNFEEAIKQLNEMPEVPEKPSNYNPRAGQYYLRKWYRLQQNINNLNDLDIAEAKILFSALNYLTDGERELLAAKYHTPLRKKNGVTTRITDKEAADNLGVDEKSYANGRRRLEHKMNFLIAKYKTEFEDEREKAVLLIHGR